MNMIPENQKYSKAALSSMYKHGQGILSPERFSTKKRSFQFFGFASGAFTPIVIAKFFGVAIEGSIVYVVLCAGVITGILGAILLSSIFNANFIRDDSLQDPLFDYLKDIDRR